MKEKKTSECIGAMIGGVIGLVIVNSVPGWAHLTHGVILESWTKILWAANLSMILQIVGNFFLAVYRPARLYSFIQLILALAGLVSAIVFYNVFPLDFSHIVGNWLNILVKALLILGIAGSFIAVIVHLVRTILGTQYKPKQSEIVGE
jgi:predicted neutral ceramidase superfamily lipid hydrolase